MGGTKGHHVRQSKPNSEGHVTHVLSHVWDLEWERGAENKRED